MCVAPKVVCGKLLPCGTCYQCKNKIVKDWVFRIALNSKQYNFERVHFVTLTYNNESLPSNGLLCKKDLMKFFHSLRNGFCRRNNIKISYFAVGEYGGKFGRPHYHCIVFGLPKDFNYSRYWKKGFIDKKFYDGNLTSLFYMVKYLNKSNSVSRCDPVTGEVVPEFRIFSKRLGINYFEEKYLLLYKKEFYNSLLNGFSFTSSDGRKYSFHSPRFLKDYLRRYHSQFYKYFFDKYKKSVVYINDFSKYKDLFIRRFSDRYEIKFFSDIFNQMQRQYFSLKKKAFFSSKTTYDFNKAYYSRAYDVIYSKYNSIIKKKFYLSIDNYLFYFKQYLLNNYDFLL